MGAFRAVGGFDERFRIAYNDVDLCLRLGKLGYETVYTPDALVFHAESATRGFGRQPRIEDLRFARAWR
jgi:GT2 family glycosyltransferase